MARTNAERQAAYRTRKAARAAAAHQEALQALNALGSPTTLPAAARTRLVGRLRALVGDLAGLVGSPLKHHMCSGPRRGGPLAPGPDHQASDGALT